MVGNTRASRLNSIWVLAIMGLLNACSGTTDQVTAERSDSLSISGSVGDGPIVDAEMTVEDADGTVVLTEVGSSTANYQIAIPDGTLMPVLIRANGGTDLVTGRAADFELLAVATESGEQTINVSPLTTLAVRTAECSVGGLNAASLRDSWTTIHREVGMGLDSSLVGDPMGEPVTEANVEMVVLANEALGEAVRRTQIALTSAGTTIDRNEVIRQLGCDLADGVLNGVGPSLEARVISTFRAVEVAVLLEVIAGRLEVDGQDATGLMDQAIRVVMPSFPSPNVAAVAVTSGILDQTRDALAILQGVYPDLELFTLLVLLDGSSLTQARSDVSAALSNATLSALTGLVDRVANAGNDEIDLLASRMAVQEQTNPPIVSFDAVSISLTEGQTTLLSWATVDADQCVAAQGWSGSVMLNGTYQIDSLTTTTTFRLTCTGNGGATTQSVTVNVSAQSDPTPDPDPSPTPTPEPVPVVDLSAADEVVMSGSTTILAWTTQNASSCTAGAGWFGNKGTSGSEMVGPLTANTTFTLACTGSGGTSTQTVSVIVSAPPAPTLSFSSSDVVVDSGASTTLNWSTQNAVSCSASGGWFGSKGTSGSEVVGPLTANTTFTLACTGSGGTSNRAVAVTVTAPPATTLSFSASDLVVDSGDSTTLSWNSQNASSCTASGGWSGSKGTSGSETVGPLTLDTTFALSCSGSGGTSSDTATVMVNTSPEPTLNFSASSVVVDSGDNVTLSWTSQNASSCTASGGWSGSKGTSGSEIVGPLTLDTTFALSCSGSGGTSSDTATVTVTAPPAPTLSFSASDLVVDSGNNTSLNWTAQNATSCNASGGWSGNKGTSGTELVGPISANTTYSLTCTGVSGNVVEMIGVSVNGVLQLSWVAPTENVDGSPLTNLTGYNIYYGTASGNYSDSVAISDSNATQHNLTVVMDTYYVAITALDADGNESAYSNEVTKVVN